MWDDVEKKLKLGLTYREITQYTGVEEKYIKQIDDYIKENANAKRDISKSN
jgi:uncharacterized protein YeeX (DUF496 family)